MFNNKKARKAVTMINEYMEDGHSYAGAVLVVCVGFGVSPQTIDAAYKSAVKNADEYTPVANFA